LTSAIETFRRAAGGCEAVSVAREESWSSSGSNGIACYSGWITRIVAEFVRIHRHQLMKLRNFHKFRYDAFTTLL
jgi:hypothetical protein